MDLRYPLVLAVILVLMIVTPVIFIFQRHEFSGEDLPFTTFKDLLGSSTNIYFLYPQDVNSSDLLSAQEFARVLINYSLIEHYYQLDDSFVGSDGYPRPEAISNGECIILVGGPSAHACVKYYEDTKQAPLIEKWTATDIWWETRDERIADEIFTARTDLDEHHDMFIIEFFKDNNGRNVLIYYGHNLQGTQAAGQYFSQLMYQRISNYDKSYYIFSWVDSNNDASPDINEVIENVSN